MKKSDFQMICEECCKDEIVIYSSIIRSMIGYYCIICKKLFMFDGYTKLDTYDEDLKRLRQEYSKSVAQSLEQSLKEMNAMRQGKAKKRSWKEFILNEKRVTDEKKKLLKEIMGSYSTRVDLNVIRDLDKLSTNEELSGTDGMIELAPKNDSHREWFEDEADENKRQYTYADYLTWTENERIEIVDGMLYVQVTPSPEHQLISGELFRQIANYLQGKPCKVYNAPFCVRLAKGDESKDEDIKNIFEPDITIVCDQTKMDENGCNGTPDMIIEVVSASSINHDKVTKFIQYEIAGVKEYWIVEPECKLVSVFVLENDGRYGRQEIYTEDEKITVSLFTDLIVDLSTVFPFPRM